MQGYYNIQISSYCPDIPRSYVSIFRYFVIYKYFISDSKIQTFLTVQTFLIHTFQYSNISLYDIYISYLIHKIQIFLTVSSITSNAQIFRYTNISYLIHKIQTFLTVSSITFNVQIFRYTNISYLIHKVFDLLFYILICKDITTFKHSRPYIPTFRHFIYANISYLIHKIQSFRFAILYSNLQGYNNTQTSRYSNIPHAQTFRHPNISLKYSYFPKGGQISIRKSLSHSY